MLTIFCITDILLFLDQNFGILNYIICSIFKYSPAVGVYGVVDSGLLRIFQICSTFRVNPIRIKYYNNSVAKTAHMLRWPISYSLIAAWAMRMLNESVSRPNKNV